MTFQIQAVSRKDRSHSAQCQALRPLVSNESSRVDDIAVRAPHHHRAEYNVSEGGEFLVNEQTDLPCHTAP